MWVTKHLNVGNLHLLILATKTKASHMAKIPLFQYLFLVFSNIFLVYMSLGIFCFGDVVVLQNVYYVVV